MNSILTAALEFHELIFFYFFIGSLIFASYLMKDVRMNIIGGWVGPKWKCKPYNKFSKFRGKSIGTIPKYDLESNFYTIPRTLMCCINENYCIMYGVIT
jgi:hypothetical protein